MVEPSGFVFENTNDTKSRDEIYIIRRVCRYLYFFISHFKSISEPVKKISDIGKGRMGERPVF